MGKNRVGFHLGIALLIVAIRYDKFQKLNLTETEKNDLVEYLKSI